MTANPKEPPMPSTDTRPRTYPGADTTTQWFGEGNVTMPRIRKVVLHSTETRGWPGYAGGRPQMTYNPWTHTFRQHMPILGSATALVDPDSTPVRENRDEVFQLEIICYCDNRLSSVHGHAVEDLDEEALRDIAELLVWLHVEHGLPLVWAPRWSTTADTSEVRMTGAEFDRFEGICGHQHVSGNHHWDPGALNVAGIKELVDEILPPVTTTPPPAPKPPAPTPAPPPAPPKEPTVPATTVAVVPGGRVYTAYRKPGTSWAAGYHTGEDWHTNSGAGDYGKRVNAPVTGRVVHAGRGGWGPAYGIQVIIQDATGDRTMVAHLQSESVSVGQQVVAGQQVGRQGDTGNAAGPHVHVERRHKPYGYWDHERPVYGSPTSGGGGAAGGGGGGAYPTPLTRIVYVSKLRPGQQDSDSVWWAQRALNEIVLRNGRELRLTGDYDAPTIAEVKKLQSQKFMDPADGDLGPTQTREMFKLARIIVDIRP